MRYFSRLAALLCCTIATLATASAEKRVALVIGNGAYVHATFLPNPATDAEAVTAALRRLQFDDVTLLRDLGADAFRKALLDFELKATGADIAVVYFAGHGIEVDGQNFLIPVDAKLARAAAAELEAIPLSTVTTVISAARKLRLVILDACRTNPFRARMTADGSQGRKRSIGRGLGRISDTGDNELIVFAAAEGTEADDGVGKHSPFTAALLKHMEAPAIDVRLMFGKVRDDVLKATGRQQTPHIYGTLGGEVIALASTGAPKPPDLTPPPAPPTPEYKDLTPRPLPAPKLPEGAFTLRPSDSAWVKLCDKGKLKGKNKDGKDVTKDLETCMTLHERVHPDTGMTLIGATLVHVKMDGKEKNSLQVTVPPGVLMQHGVTLMVYPKDLWAKAARNQKLDRAEEDRLRKSAVKLPYTRCLATGCQAETEATPALINALKGGGGFMVFTVREPYQPVLQPVPLNGFSQALTGRPTDTQKFNKAREQLIKAIAERQKKLKR